MSRFVQKRLFATSLKGKRAVNQPYQPKKLPLPPFTKVNNTPNPYDTLHNNPDWPMEAVQSAIHDHCVMTWGATDSFRDNATFISRGEGVYIYDENDRPILDFSSQAVCTNLGHTLPPDIHAAIESQMKKVCHLYPGSTLCAVRGKLSKLLADILPADLNGFLFPSSGAEANECAIRIARNYTGKQKIISRYRSYHGGTLGALAVTGDFRNKFVSNDVHGFIKTHDPKPMYFRWTDSDSEDKIADAALQALHEQILHENPSQIAAIILEPITGTLGWLKPPTKYMQGVRALCDKYGMLMICDEVMAGFCRTGKLFSFMHYEGVVPDLVTFAKGITAAILPMSGVGVRQPILEHFRTHPLGYGSTYNSHPVSMACGYAVVKHLVDNKISERVARMEPVMAEAMNDLLSDPKAGKHVMAARVVGLGGCLDIMDAKSGDYLCSPNEVHPKMQEFRNALIKNGLYTMVRGNLIHCAPPLIIEESQIQEGFAKIKKSIVEVFE